MKDLRKGLIAAQTLLYNERSKITKKQKLIETSVKNQKYQGQNHPLALWYMQMYMILSLKRINQKIILKRDLSLMFL